MNATHEFAKYIPAYLDGLMNEQDRLEFEERVASDKALAQLFRQRVSEQNSLIARVPQTELDPATLEALEGEVRETIENLFKDDDAPATKRLKSWLEDLF